MMHPFNDKGGSAVIFGLTYKSGSQIYYLIIGRTKRDDKVEEFRISARERHWQKILVQNNRPYLREVLNLKYKKLSWKLLEGQIRNQSAFKAVIALIEKELEKYPLVKNIHR